MNKTEAAAFLEVSVRAIERYVAADKLPAHYIRGKTGQMLDFDQADLERFKTELETPTPKGGASSSTTSDEPRQEAQDKTRQEASNQPRQGSTTALVKAVVPHSESSQVGSGLGLLVQALQELQKSGGRSLSVPVEAKPLLTLVECSALTGLSRATLKGAVDEGKLHARQIGRAWRVRRDELDQWLQTL